MKQADVNILAAYLLGRNQRLPGDNKGLALLIGCRPAQAEMAKATLLAADLVIMSPIGEKPVMLYPRRPRRESFAGHVDSPPDHSGL